MSRENSLLHHLTPSPKHYVIYLWPSATISAQITINSLSTAALYK